MFFVFLPPYHHLMPIYHTLYEFIFLSTQLWCLDRNWKCPCTYRIASSWGFFLYDGRCCYHFKGQPHQRESRKFSGPTWQEWKSQGSTFSFVENRVREFKGSLLTELPWEAGMRLELEFLYNSHATSWLFYLFLPLLHNKYKERTCHWVSSWRNQAPLLPPKDK